MLYSNYVSVSPTPGVYSPISCEYADIMGDGNGAALAMS